MVRWQAGSGDGAADFSMQLHSRNSSAELHPPDWWDLFFGTNELSDQENHVSALCCHSGRKIGCLFFICITGFIKMPENRHSNMPVMNRKKASYSAGCKNQTSGLLTYKSYWFFLVIMDILWRRRSTGPSWKEVMVWGRMCVQTQKVSEKNVRNNRSP